MNAFATPAPHAEDLRSQPASTTTLDAGQAYEQTRITHAVSCLLWAACWVWQKHQALTVTILLECKGASKLGGNPRSVLDFNGPLVVLTTAEICQYIFRKMEKFIRI